MANLRKTLSTRWNPGPVHWGKPSQLGRGTLLGVQGMQIIVRLVERSTDNFVLLIIIAGNPQGTKK